MHRKLLTVLVSACALAAVMVGPTTASASTLALTGSLGDPNYTENAYFESDSTSVSFGGFTAQCGAFSLGTAITQNQSNPVTLQLGGGWAGSPSLVGCPNGFAYSNIQVPSPMQFTANGTGTLPLRVTETWNGSSSCVRQGTLNLTYTPDPDGQWDYDGSPVGFDGYLTRTSGSIACPISARLQGTFGGYGSADGPNDELGGEINFIVVP